MDALRAVRPPKPWLAGSSWSYASTSTIRPPTPSTSSVAPTSAGATSWTLRAKSSAGSARVVAGEGGDGKGDQDRTHDAREAAGDDREAEARQRRDEAGLDVAERGGRGDLRELDPGDTAPQLVGRHRPQDRPAQDGAEGRAGDVRGAAVDVLDRVRRRELVRLDEARDDGVHAADAEREDRHRERDEDVDRPDPRLGQARVQREQQRDEREQRLGREQQPAAVDSVGDRAADDRERQQREELAQREQPDLQGRVREAVELKRRSDGGDLAAEGGDRLADEEAAERGVAAQRADVDDEPAQQPGLADLGRFQARRLEELVVLVGA